MKILVATSSVPDPRAGGERFHAFSLLRALAADHDVSVLAVGHAASDAEGMAEARRLCRRAEMVVVPKWNRALQVPRMAVRLARGWPSDSVFYFSRGFERALARLLAQDRYDAVHLERYVMLPYLDTVRAAGVPQAVVRVHNVNSTLCSRMAAVEPNLAWRTKHRLDAWACKGWERTRLWRFDRVLAVSELDAASLREACSASKVGVLPLCLDTEETRPLPPPDRADRILMLGPLHYLPNADAARFMVNEILPLVRRALPSVALDLVGSRPPPDLTALAKDTGGLRLPGFVDDPLPWYRRAGVLAVPLRAGSGVRHKIVEAMALGRPVVSTSLGAEGLGLRHGVELLLADSPEEFAEAVVRVLREPELAARLTGAGRAFVEAHHSLPALCAALRLVYPVP